jgi:3-hydroxyacyl-CoA dehydrogenase
MRAAMGVEIFEALKKNFETIAKAKVSTSAADARGLGFLRLRTRSR